MTHPGLTQLRNRSNKRRLRDLAVLNTEYGEVDLDTLTYPSIEARDLAEHAARTVARTLTADINVARTLEQLEQAQQAQAAVDSGLTPPTVTTHERTDEETNIIGGALYELHRAATLVDLITTAQIEEPG